jgi:sulfur carrier protein ThiS
MATSTVKVGQLPGTLKEVVVEGTTTVNDVLTLAELSSVGFEVRVSGKKADEATIVKNGDMVLLVKPIKGN